MAQYVISNGKIQRIVEIDQNGVRTVSLKNPADGLELIHEPVREFAFAADDVLYSSYCPGKIRVVDGNRDTISAVPVFCEAKETPESLELEFTVGPCSVTVVYRVYPEICGMRKYLKIRNRTGKQITISNVIFDDTSVAPGRFADCDYYAGNGDHPQSQCFTLEGNEDIIRCHNPKVNAGWIMGSTAPGILHFYMVYPIWNNVINGMNMSSAPFFRQLDSGESFTTPASLFAPYRGDRTDPETVSDFRSLVRAGLPRMKTRESIMYCTWIPFLKNMNAALAEEIAERAAKLGFGTFVIDDGWFTANDREVDPEKYPEGLEIVSQKIRELGLRFGLWLNVGTDYGMKQAPEFWFSIRPDGKPNKLGFDYSNAGQILCFGSSYREYVLQKLDELAARYHVGYFKLDFSNICSPYGVTAFGCHSKNHEHHHGWEDSIAAMYEGMFYVRDKMLERHPETVLDFSFEAFGTERPNIAALELSELHHISNLAADNPEIESIERVRKTIYRWIGKLPPERLLNGLLSIQGARGAEYLLTSFAGAPLVAGDLRKLEPEVEQRLCRFAEVFNTEAEKGPMTEIRVLEDREETDGFLRCAKDGHGIAAFFNRSEKTHRFLSPKGFILTNCETGKEELAVPPGKCILCTVKHSQN